MRPYQMCRSALAGLLVVVVPSAALAQAIAPMGTTGGQGFASDFEPETGAASPGTSMTPASALAMAQPLSPSAYESNNCSSTACCDYRHFLPHSGQIIQHPKIVSIYYNLHNSTTGTTSAPPYNLDDYMRGLVDSPFIDFLKEYSTSQYSIGRGVFLSGGVYTNTPAPFSSTIKLSGLASNIGTIVSAAVFPAPAPVLSLSDPDLIIAVYLPVGSTFVDDVYESSVQYCTPAANRCAVHTRWPAGTLPFLVIPDTSTDPCKSFCQEHSGNGLNEAEELFSHELAETITNPNAFVSGGSDAWYDDTTYLDSTAEIGDPCIGIEDTINGNKVQKIASQFAYEATATSTGAPTVDAIAMQPALQLGHFFSNAAAVTIPDAIVFDDTPAQTPAWANTFLGFQALSSSLPIYQNVKSIYPLSSGAPEYIRGAPIMAGNFACLPGWSDAPCEPAYDRVLVYNGTTQNLGLLAPSSTGYSHSNDITGPRTIRLTSVSSQGFSDLRNDQFFVGDFDGDGTADVGAWNSSTSTIVAAWSNALFTGPDFSLASTVVSPPLKGGRIYVGDFTGDGATDVAIEDPSDGSIWVGPASFTTPFYYHKISFGPFQKWADGSAILTSLGSNHFAPQVEWNAPTIVGRFTQSTHDEIMMYNSGLHRWAILRNIGTGLFVPTSLGAAGTLDQNTKFVRGTRAGTAGLDGAWVYDFTTYRYFWVTFTSTAVTVSAPIALSVPGAGMLMSSYSGYPNGSQVNSGFVTYNPDSGYVGNVYEESAGAGDYSWSWGSYGSTVGSLIGW